jgi:hypothetical protein
VKQISRKSVFRGEGIGTRGSFLQVKGSYEVPEKQTQTPKGETDMSEIAETTRKAKQDDTIEQNTQGPIVQDPGPPYDPPPTDGTEG